MRPIFSWRVSATNQGQAPDVTKQSRVLTDGEPVDRSFFEILLLHCYGGKGRARLTDVDIMIIIRFIGMR